jgi:RimJ/RimL family protein N-acetyltransferase
MKRFFSDEGLYASPRVKLEPVAPIHAEAIQYQASNAEVAATCNLPHPYPAYAARHFVDACRLAQMRGQRFTYAILAARRFVGICGLRNHRDGESCEVGYWIGRGFWGQGLATDAVAALLEKAFVQLDFELATAQCLAANPASSRVLEKTGFEFVEERLELHPKWQEKKPTRFYRLPRSAWTSARRPEVAL